MLIPEENANVMMSDSVYHAYEGLPHSLPHGLPQGRAMAVNQAGCGKMEGMAETETPWIWIRYMEKRDACGDKFVSASHVITVDSGFSNENGRRLCLGHITNPNRDERTESCRNHIGNGITIRRVNQVVTVVNNSDHKVFVQSLNLNRRMNKPEEWITKLDPGGGECEVFDFGHFRDWLRSAVGHEGVVAVERQCHIRISFIKKWGEGYKERLITGMPCWLELILLEPLEWVDKAQTGLPPTGTEPSSRS